MSGSRILAALIAGFIVAPSPARADSPAVVAANLTRAAAAVKSFVIQLQINGTTAVGGRLIFVRPLGVKGEYNIGTMTVETYLVDGMVYTHAPGSQWQVLQIDAVRAPAASADIAQSVKSSNVTLLPDRQEDGATVGVFQLNAQLPAAAGPIAQGVAQSPMVCSYDKASFRLHRCANSVTSIIYSNYNDPTNIVELPAEAKAAATAGNASPQPSP